MELKEISIKDIENVKIGNETDSANGTGCTVFLFEKGCPCGVDVRGGGPASRETTLLLPTSAAQVIHAVVLGGGSAYGLDASGGVMKFLEEKNIGFPVGNGVVPLVVQSDIFDLTCGSFNVRPDQKYGYNACVNAYEDNYQDGNFGGGTGATCGKFTGMNFCTKTGIGSYAVECGKLKVGAVVIVNALGNVYDHEGKCIAGLLNKNKNGFEDSEKLMYENASKVTENKFTGNTTIAIILTNALFDKSRLTKIASMAQNGMARSIRPVHTSADGDTVYAASTGNVKADQDAVGTLAADVLSRAIEKAVHTAQSAYGFKSSKDIMVG